MRRQSRSKIPMHLNYTKAFFDPKYGTYMEEEDFDDEDDEDEVYYSEYGDDSDESYSDEDEDVSKVVESLREMHLPKSSQSRAKRSYSPRSYSSQNIISDEAMDLAKRFIDVLNGVQWRKANYDQNDNTIAFTKPTSRSEKQNKAYNQTDDSRIGYKYDPYEMCNFIYEGIIGKDMVINQPFGPRRMIYCDFVASGKPLTFIEGYIKKYVLPMYANTHSDASDSSIQTNKFREDAREIIRHCVNGNDNDIVIFTGSGSTAAIAKMISVLKASKEIDLTSAVVMVATYEHHSNLLPWENAKVHAVIKIGLDKNGYLDLNMLTRQCQYYHSRGHIIIGSISAASNVTGILTDTVRVAEIIHFYDGFAFFDFACGAPYLKIDMNPSHYGSKDAIFISVHKFVGGPQSPGLLIAKKFLFTNVIPTNPSGGTVSFVSRTIVKYIEDPIVKEEGGTPEIVGSIRAGLAFQLKSFVTESYIHHREQELVKLFLDSFKTNSLIKILGSLTAERLAVFSFVVFHPNHKLFIHHNFIGVLLNDLFGIQARPGCACAGPYAMELLDVPESIAVRSAKYFSEDCKGRKAKLTILKQGFVRINLPYFYPQSEINFIIKAVNFVVNYGWYFLPLYTYKTENGYWLHRFFSKSYDSLKDISYSEQSMKIEAHSKKQQLPKVDLFQVAYNELRKAKKAALQINFKDDPAIMLEEGDSKLKWFLLPHEAAYFISTEK
ncbi:hypothetical protein GJ496_005864 [Pomphorhynchus laevis]|nr:hypothetical protein GJ496_005864 [Pomphorhynchus laevis]